MCRKNLRRATWLHLSEMLTNNRSSMELGQRIKKLRQKLGYTVRHLSTMAEVTPSLLSQIENNKVNPSINTLMAIAKAMKVPIGTFFEEPIPEVEPVVKRDQRKKMQTGSGVTFYLLTPKISGHLMEFIYNEYEAGGSTGELYQHDGEECGIVLEGKLEVTYGEKVYVLNEGDSIVMDSKRSHKIRNVHEGKSAAIWVNTPPTW